MKTRGRILQQFCETDLSVLLISLQLGVEDVEGSNLQAVNQVYLLDSWWNPEAVGVPACSRTWQQDLTGDLLAPCSCLAKSKRCELTSIDSKSGHCGL